MAGNPESAGPAVQFQAVLESIQDGFIALDRDYRCVYVNRAAAAVLNTTPDAVLGRTIWEVLPLPRYAQLHDQISHAAAQQTFVKFEEHCEHCDRWFEWHCYPTADTLALFIEDISERKQAEQQVVRSEQHYRLLFETMPEGILFQDVEGKIVSLNPAAEEILGATVADLRGRTSVEQEQPTLREDGSSFPDPEQPSLVALRTGQEVRNVVLGVFNPRRQAYRWISVSAVPLVRPNEGQPYQVYTHFTDVTELRQALQALQHSERRFRKLFEADLMGIFITKPDGTFLDCNEAMVKMLGYGSRSELLHRRSTELYVDPEFRQEAVRILREKGVYLGQEGRVYRKDGSIAHLLGAAVLLQDEETGEPYIQGVAIDITERRRAEQALTGSQQFLQRITETTPDVIYIYDLLEHRNIYANRARAEILGYSAQECEALGCDFLQHLVHPEDLPNIMQHLARLEAGPDDQVLEIDYRMRHADGTYHWLRSRDTVFSRTPEGRVSQILGLARDVTERRRTEEALRRSEERYRRLFEANLAGVYLTKLDGTILNFNETMRKMLGYGSRAELLQKRSSDFYVDPELRQELLRLLQRDGVVPGREALLRRKDGSVLYALGAAALLTEEGTGERYIQGVAVDITERKRAEERLAKSLKDLELLSVTATHYLEALPAREIFEYTAQQLQAVAGQAMVAVTEYDPGTNQVAVCALAEPEGIRRKAIALLGRDPVGLKFTLTEGVRAQMVPGRLARMKGGLYDLTFHQMSLALATLLERECRIGEIYVMPFCLGEELVGTVVVATDWAEGLKNRELIEGIVNQAALALKRTRTETALRRSEQALLDLTTTLETRVAQRTEELERRARQLQKLTLELSEAEDQERRRLAEILHDDLQQVLAAAKFHLGLLRNRARHDATLQTDAAQIEHLLREAIEKSRSLSHELSPAVLHYPDFAETLRWLASDIQTKHGLEVHVQTREAAQPHSEALRMFLYRAAQEMLFNVVKHSRVKEARLHLRAHGPCLCLSVSDHGRGFDPAELRETLGFGLLRIRERVELLGGRMKIRSAKGKGSTFFLAVPNVPEPEVQRPETEGSKGQAEGELPSSERSLRVLLADDHEIVRQGLLSLLGEEHRVEVVGEAADGREAVDLTDQLQPDVVIMDVSLPVVNGAEATRQIKTRRPETRVVAFSMSAEPEVVQRMHEAGAESYVLKTAPSEELLAAIRGR